MNNYTTKQESYIFSSFPKIREVDIHHIEAIENFYRENHYLPEEYVPLLLDWLITNARKTVEGPLENHQNSSYLGKCSTTQQLMYQVLSKMGFSSYPFNIGKLLTGDASIGIHAVLMLNLNILTSNGIVQKNYLLDPTFRQFCTSQENRYERYFEEPKWQVNVATPHPGYFLNLTENGRNFGENLIQNGYFEMTDTNSKTYFDAFALYTMPKERYLNPNLLGKIYATNYTAADYYTRMNQCIEPQMYTVKGSIKAPKEVREREEKRMINRIKKIFGKRQNFQLQDIPKEEIRKIA